MDYLAGDHPKNDQALTQLQYAPAKGGNCKGTTGKMFPNYLTVSTKYHIFYSFFTSSPFPSITISLFLFCPIFFFLIFAICGRGAGKNKTSFQHCKTRRIDQILKFVDRTFYQCIKSIIFSGNGLRRICYNC